MRDLFWEKLPLEALTPDEWEALCDGCGLCCLVKLEDEDTGRIYFTNLLCRLLDPETCRCTDYENRHEEVADCRAITLQSLREIDWLPPTCAYRLREQGKPLLWWHPLISGNPSSVHEAGQSAQGWTFSEEGIPECDYERFLVEEPLW